MKLKLYCIEEDYIEFLRKYDKRVAYNKGSKRPYVGIVYTYEKNNYFAPLSSPKEKHKKLSRKNIDIFKIENGNLGIININNMIPCNMFVLTEILPSLEKSKYKTLLENQIEYINAHKEYLVHKIKLFMKRYKEKTLQKNIVDRCCNFELLENIYNNYKI